MKPTHPRGMTRDPVKGELSETWPLPLGSWNGVTQKAVLSCSLRKCHFCTEKMD